MKFKLHIILSAIILLGSNVTFGQIDSIQNEIVYNWKLNPYDLNLERVDVDTSLFLFHNYNPLLKNTITTNYLGNMGSPALLNIYTDRKRYETGFIFSEPYGVYFHLPKDQLYYNTKRQFTIIDYSNTGPKDESEQLLGILHTQNVNKDFNVGVDYNMISSDGRYFNQQIRQNNITLFSSFKHKGYRVHTNYNLNRVKAQENGGIDSLWYVGADEYRNRRNIPVKLDDAGSHVLATNFYLAQEYEFGKKKVEVKITEKKEAQPKGEKKKNLQPGINNKNGLNKKDEKNMNQGDSLIITDTIPVYYDTTYVETIEFSGFSVSHELSYNRNVRKYFDETLTDSFYNEMNLYMNELKTNDQVYQKDWGNKLSLNYKRSDKLSVRLSYYNEHIGYLYKIVPDTVITETSEGVQDTIVKKEKSKDFYNNSVSFYLKGLLFNHILWEGYGEYFFSGYKEDNTNAEVRLAYKFGHNELGLKTNYQNEYPDYLYRNYSSNHFQWNNSSLKSSVEWKARVYYENQKFNFNTNLSYIQISNYLFLDNQTNVSQYTDNLKIYSGEIYKKISLGPIRSVTRFVYQKTTNDSIMSLPEYNLYQSLFYERLSKFKNTGGELLWQVGIDYRFASKYKADAYMPVLGLFHRQYELEQEAFNRFDIFINLTIKKVRLYFKYSYINSALSEKYYFNSPFYPSPEPAFQFGLTWMFYN